MLTAGDDDLNYTFTYNTLGQQSRRQQRRHARRPTVVLSNGFNANGNRTSLDATIGTNADFQNSYTYDSFGNEISVTQQGATDGDDVAAKNITFSYDQGNRLTGINRYASTSIANSVAQSVYSYDDDGNLTGLSDVTGSGSSATTLAGYSWTYDLAGLVQTFANSQDSSENLSYQGNRTCFTVQTR